MKRYLRTECPYIIYDKGNRAQRYAFIQVDFTGCENLNTPEARYDVLKLFRRYVMINSPFWCKLFTLYIPYYKDSFMKSIVMNIFSAFEHEGDVTIPHVIGLCGKNTAFGIGYNLWNFCAEKELIENFVPVLVRFVTEKVCRKKICEDKKE
jgi:hypothetical protein